MSHSGSIEAKEILGKNRLLAEKIKLTFTLPEADQTRIIPILDSILKSGAEACVHYETIKSVDTTVFAPLKYVMAQKSYVAPAIARLLVKYGAVDKDAATNIEAIAKFAGIQMSELIITELSLVDALKKACLNYENAAHPPAYNHDGGGAAVAVSLEKTYTDAETQTELTDSGIKAFEDHFNVVLGLVEGLQ
jgi:hypothetical protein